MPITLDAVVAAPEDVEFGAGESKLGPYKVGPLRMYELGRVQRILNRLARSPIEEAESRLEGLPDPERKELWARAKEAAARWVAPQVGSYEASQLLMNDPDASREVFGIILEAYNPGISAEAVETLFRSISRAAFIAVWQMAMEVWDPKALLASATGLTEEVETALKEASAMHDKLAPLLSPLRWITGSTPGTSSSPAA